MMVLTRATPQTTAALSDVPYKSLMLIKILQKFNCIYKREKKTWRKQIWGNPIKNRRNLKKDEKWKNCELQNAPTNVQKLDVDYKEYSKKWNKNDKRLSQLYLSLAWKA